MTLKATFIAPQREAQRISDFLERDYGEFGVAISLRESGDAHWLVEAYFEDENEEDWQRRCATGSVPMGSRRRSTSSVCRRRTG